MAERNSIQAFFIGATIGFVAAVLLAPKSGRELRTQVSDSASDALEKVKHQASGLQERVRTKTGEVRSAVSQVAQRVRTRDIATLLNEVSKDDLIAVSGIDAALADRIIGNRPYRRERELLEKGLIPEGAFQALREELLRRRAA
jgi:gas vesicle protein